MAQRRHTVESFDNVHAKGLGLARELRVHRRGATMSTFGCRYAKLPFGKVVSRYPLWYY